MRVAVIGLGAIGRLLTEALANRVDLVGIDRTKAPPRDGEEPVDVAVVSVKTPGTRWAAAVAARVLAPEGAALTVQNGLGNREILAAAIGDARVSAGALYAGAYLEGERLVTTSGAPRLDLARPTSEPAAARLDALAAALREAGWEIAIVADASPLLWRKVVVNAAINPVTAILAIPNGALPGHAGGALVADVLASEAARVATAAGVAIAADEARALWRGTAERTATNRSSMLEDVRAKRETEIDAICGEIGRRGSALGAPAPLNEAMAGLVGALRMEQG